jgi:hypothetical protein
MAATDLQDLEKLKELLNELKQSEDFAEPYFERAEDYYKLSRIIPNDDAEWPYLNRIRTADTFSFVEDASSKIFNTIFSVFPFISWKKRVGLGNEGLPTILESLTNWMIESEIDEFTHEQYEAVKTKCIYGTSHFGIFPHYDTYKRGEVCVGARYLTADFWDVLPNVADYRAGRNARSQWYREWLDPAEVESMFKDGTFIGSFADIPEVGSAEGGFKREWHKELLQEIGWENYPISEPNGMEIWNRYDDGQVITIINRGYIARDTALTTPRKKYLPYNVPFTDMRYIIWPKEYWGMGVPESLEQLQKDKDLIRSQHRENIDLVLNAVMKVKRDANIDINDLEMYPSALLMVEDMDDIEIWTPNDVTSQSVIPIESKIETEMDRSTGLYRYGRGETPPHGRERATTVVKLQQAGLGRMETQIKLTELYAIRRMGYQLAMLGRHKLNKDIFQKVAGVSKEEAFKDTDDFDMKYLVDAQPVGSAVSQIKELRIDQMLQTLDLITKFPPAITQDDPEPFRVAIRKVLATTLVALGHSKREVDEEILPKLAGSTTQPPIVAASRGKRGTPDEVAALKGGLDQAANATVEE